LAKRNVPILDAPKGRRDEFVEPYFKSAEPDAVVVVLKAREPARIMTGIGDRAANRWHLQFAERWVIQYNFYVNDARWGRMFVRMRPYLQDYGLNRCQRFLLRACRSQRRNRRFWAVRPRSDWHRLLLMRASRWLTFSASARQSSAIWTSSWRSLSLDDSANFRHCSALRTSCSLSAAAFAATSASRRSNSAFRSASYAAAVAGSATGSGPASRMAANDGGGINWSSTTRHCLLPSTQMSPARSRSRNANRVAASQMRRSNSPEAHIDSRQVGRRKLVGRLRGHFRPPPP
jgi:hypothetical protein